jgi:ABC-type multidrug transport system ATPase subunit
MALLEADAIGKAYGSRRILTAASLRAYPGSITALCGRNGSGKSTLLAIAAGWRHADTGMVHFDGRTWLRPRLPALAEHGLFLLPDRAILVPELPLGRQLGAVERRFGTAGSTPAVAAALGLSGCLELLPPRLSGGETRRAELALACVRRPRCLLADEPFRGLSPLDAEAIAAALRGLAREGCAIVVTGHEITILLELADVVTWCAEGTTMEFPSAQAARDDWRFQRDYLGAVPDDRSSAGSAPDPRASR